MQAVVGDERDEEGEGVWKQCSSSPLACASQILAVTAHDLCGGDVLSPCERDADP